MSSTTIAVCSIMRNETSWAPGLLDNAQALGDEVHVVDTGSSDGTPALCRAAGAIVHEYPTDNMAEARNFAFTLPSTEWVLMLDADERISRCDLLRLRDALSEESPDCYSLPIHNYVGGGAWATVYSPRLLRRRARVCWEGAFHETLLNNIARQGLSMEDLPIPIRHLEYLTPAKLQAKRLRNIQRMKPLIDDRESDVQPVALTLGALDVFAVGETSVAVGMFEEAAQQAPRSFLCNWLLARALLSVDRVSEAEAVLSGLLTSATVPRDRALVTVALADVADRQGSPDLAFEQISEVTDEVYQPANLLNSAALCFKRGDPTGAEELIRASFECDPVNFAPILWGPRAEYSSYTLQTAQIAAFTDLVASGFFRSVVRSLVPPRTARGLNESLDPGLSIDESAR